MNPLYLQYLSRASILQTLSLILSRTSGGDDFPFFTDEETGSERLNDSPQDIRVKI